MSRYAWRAVALLGTLIVSLFLMVSPASAHTDLGTSTPAPEALVAETPKEIVLNFTNPVDPQRFTAELLFRDGTPVAFSGAGPQFSDDLKTVTLTPPTLERGTYALVWKSVDASGHLSVGQLVFSVQVVSGIQAGSNPFTSILAAAPGTAVRYAGFLAAGLLLGWWVTVMFAARRAAGAGAAAEASLPESGGEVPSELDSDASSEKVNAATSEPAEAASSWVKRAARVRLVSVTVLALALLAKPALALAAVASVGALSTDTVVTMLTDMPNAAGWWLTALALIAALASLRAQVLAPVAVVMAVLADALSSHLAPLPEGPILVPLLTLHVAGFLVWFGLPLAWWVIRPEAGWKPFLSMFTLPAATAALAVMISGPLLWIVRAGSFDEVLASLSGLYGQVAASKLALVLLILVPLGLVHVTVAIRRRVTAVLAQEKGLDPVESTVHLRRPRRIVGAELATLMVAVLAGSLLVGLVPVTRAELKASGDVLAVAGSWEECDANQDQEARFLCLVKFIDKTVREQDAATVLRDLNSRTDAGETFALHNCHELSHKIGRAAWLKYGDLGTALQQGQDNCDFGYTHGIIEGFALGVADDQLVPALAEKCDNLPFDRYDHQTLQCYHGIGHAIGRRVNLDMNKAFDMCRFFNDPVRVASRPTEHLANQEFLGCGTGAIMEWTLRPGYKNEIKMPIGSPGTTLALCNSLDEVFHEACFEYVTSPLGPVPAKLMEVRNWCYENVKNPIACYRSIGRDAMWGSFSNSSEISEQSAVDMCYYGENQDAISNCLRWALGSVVAVYHNIEAFDRVCKLIDPGRQRTLCPDVRDSMVASLASNQRGEDSVVGG